MSIFYILTVLHWLVLLTISPRFLQSAVSVDHILPTIFRDIIRWIKLNHIVFFWKYVTKTRAISTCNIRWKSIILGSWEQILAQRIHIVLFLQLESNCWIQRKYCAKKKVRYFWATNTNFFVPFQNRPFWTFI